MDNKDFKPMDDKSTPKNKSRWLVLTVIGLVIAVGAGVVLIMGSRKTDKQQSTNVTNAAQTMSPEAYNDRITHPDSVHNIVIKGEKIVSGQANITVKKGQSVNVNFTTLGEEIDLKLDGYDIITETNSEPGASGGFHFIADTAGSFKYYIPAEADEAEEPAHDIQLGVIKVVD